MDAACCLLALLVMTAVALPAAAQTSTSVGTNLVRQADLVVVCRVLRVRPVDGGKLLSTALQATLGVSILKGTADLANEDVFIADGGLPAPSPNVLCILFAHADPAHGRCVLLADPKAIIPATLGVAKEILGLANAQSKLEITLTTDQPSYPCGAHVTLIWRFRNIGNGPAAVYAGNSAFSWSASGRDQFGREFVHRPFSGGGTFSTYNHDFRAPVDKEPERTPADYRTLAIGEQFEHRVAIEEMIPPGTLSIQMGYDCKDNRVGPGDAAQTVANVVFAHEDRRLTVEVAPADDAFLKTAAAGLTAPIWEEQRSMLYVVSQDPRGSALPEVAALSKHPWPVIRMAAADALTEFLRPMSTALRDLLYDPDIRIRNQVLQYWTWRHVDDIQLSVMALKYVTDEAIGKGFLPEMKDTRSMDYVFLRDPDPRLGDLWLARLKAGTDDGYNLAHVLGIQARFLVGGKCSIPPEGVAEVEKAWDLRRPGVKGVWTEDDLKREMDLCRTQTFNDFTLDSRFKDIYDLLPKCTAWPIVKDEDRKALLTMGPESAPTIFFITSNSYRQGVPAFFLEACVDWKIPGMFDRLLAYAYSGSAWSPPILLRLDKARAYPHLVYLYRTNPGAAIALASLGEKRAVPYICRALGRYDNQFDQDAARALAVATGKTMAGWWEWRDWWDREGSKENWEGPDTSSPEGPAAR